MGYDDDLVRNEPGNLAAEEDEAFMAWADAEFPDMDWDVDWQILKAHDAWAKHLDAIADKAQAEIDRFEQEQQA